MTVFHDTYADPGAYADALAHSVSAPVAHSPTGASPAGCLAPCGMGHPDLLLTGSVAELGRDGHEEGFTRD